MTADPDSGQAEKAVEVKPGDPGTKPIGTSGGEVVDRAVPPPETLSRDDAAK